MNKLKPIQHGIYDIFMLYDIKRVLFLFEGLLLIYTNIQDIVKI